METQDKRERAAEPAEVTHAGSTVATHRRAERMRAFTYHPRPEARM